MKLNHNFIFIFDSFLPSKKFNAKDKTTKNEAKDFFLSNCDGKIVDHYEMKNIQMYGMILDVCLTSSTPTTLNNMKCISEENIPLRK